MANRNSDSEILTDQDQISAEFIEQLKSNDSRWRDVDFGLKIENELQTSEALQCVLQVINMRAAGALDKLIDVDPTDTKKIMSLQAQVQCARIIGETLESVRRRGAIAAENLQEDDRQGLLMNEEGKEHGDRG